MKKFFSKIGNYLWGFIKRVILIVTYIVVTAVCVVSFLIFGHESIVTEKIWSVSDYVSDWSEQ